MFSVFQGKKVIITGHTGFKGSWLSIWLNHLGANVVGISVDVPTTPSHFESAKLSDFLSDLRSDIRNYTQISEIFEKEQPDFVFHLAAQPLVRLSYSDPVATWEVNTMGTICVLEALRKLDSKNCTAIFITSDKCYDNVEWEWGYKETDSLGGPDPYSASKGATEIAIKSYVKSYFPKEGNIRIGIGRAGNVIGGGDWALDRIVPDCVKSAYMGKAVEIRNPASTRPWQHVLEPLSGYINLAALLFESNALHGEPFNFGPSSLNNYSVGELADKMNTYWAKIKWDDVSQKYGGPYESSLLKLNCDKALYHMKWRAIWDFDETVFETVSWYKKYYEESKSNIIEYSISQIDKYTAKANLLNIKWAK